MFKRFGLSVLARGQALALLLFTGAALAGDKEPLAVLELGAAGEWGVNSANSRLRLASARQRRLNLPRYKIGSSLKRESPHNSARDKLNGTPILYSKSHLIYRHVSSLNPALGLSGFAPLAGAEQPTASAPRRCLTSCFGRQRIESTVGSWSRATRTLLPAVTNNRSV